MKWKFTEVCISTPEKKERLPMKLFNRTWQKDDGLSTVVYTCNVGVNFVGKMMEWGLLLKDNNTEKIWVKAMKSGMRRSGGTPCSCGTMSRKITTTTTKNLQICKNMRSLMISNYFRVQWLKVFILYLKIHVVFLYD